MVFLATIAAYTGLGTKGSLGGGNNGITKQDVGFTLELSQHLGEVEQLSLSRAHPGGKVPHLPVVAIIGQPHFRSLHSNHQSDAHCGESGQAHDQENLSVEANNPAIVSEVPVENGHANVQENTMGALILEQDAEHLQTVS